MFTDRSIAILGIEKPVPFICRLLHFFRELDRLGAGLLKGDLHAARVTIHQPA